MVSLTEGRSGKVNMFPFHVILVTVLKDRLNVSASIMVPGQEFNLHVVRDTESFINLFTNIQTSIDNNWEGTA